ncbi:hypothetical protein ANCCAN_09009 [Ancylostoma caninum]|uniref:Uncharacterized protein n=1 Tax=Ancylostoma caninum TaxID=29170 RepID=A0A368GPM4_ANCCA|nr:hypothetical protein ANCCAN_09009 [Ancylostoma caninum]
MSSHDFLFNLQLQQFVQQLYTTNLLLAQNPADFYGHHDPLPALPLQVDQLLPGLYSAPHPPPRQLDNPPPPLAPIVQDVDVPAPSVAQAVQDIAPVQLFRGEKEVTDDVFHSDPCRLPHTCLPLDRYVDKAERVTYKVNFTSFPVCLHYNTSHFRAATGCVRTKPRTGLLHIAITPIHPIQF